MQLCVRTTERAVHTLDPALLSTLFSLHVLPVIQEILLETPPLPTLALRILLPLLSVLPEVGYLVKSGYGCRGTQLY